MHDNGPFVLLASDLELCFKTWCLWSAEKASLGVEKDTRMTRQGKKRQKDKWFHLQAATPPPSKAFRGATLDSHLHPDWISDGLGQATTNLILHPRACDRLGEANCKALLGSSVLILVVSSGSDCVWEESTLGKKTPFPGPSQFSEFSPHVSQF